MIRISINFIDICSTWKFSYLAFGHFPDFSKLFTLLLLDIQTQLSEQLSQQKLEQEELREDFYEIQSRLDQEEKRRSKLEEKLQIVERAAEQKVQWEIDQVRKEAYETYKEWIHERDKTIEYEIIRDKSFTMSTMTICNRW